MCATSCKGFCALRRVLTLALGLADQGSALGVEQIIPDPISARYDDIPLLEQALNSTAATRSVSVLHAPLASLPEASLIKHAA